MLNNERVSRMQWNTIFSGTFMMLGFALFSVLLGNAIGLNINNTSDPTVTGALKFWSWIYNAVMLVASYGLGAFFATRTSHTGERSAAIHGVVSWGLANAIVAFFLLLDASTGRSIIEGVGPDAGNWFAAAVIGCGFLTSVFGGASGQSAMQVSGDFQGEKQTDQIVNIHRGAA